MNRYSPSQRSKSYLGSFVNSPEGLSSYSLMVKQIRQTVTGGRFVKMFRGNHRSFREFRNCRTGKLNRYYSASSRKAGATHFDVYLLHREHKAPKFFNFTLS